MLCFFKSMEVGDLGHPGTPALSPVVEESNPANVSALIQFLSMVERIALVMLLCLKCATNRTVLSVNYANIADF